MDIENSICLKKCFQNCYLSRSKLYHCTVFALFIQQQSTLYPERTQNCALFLVYGVVYMQYCSLSTKNGYSTVSPKQMLASIRQELWLQVLLGQ